MMGLIPPLDGTLLNNRSSSLPFSDSDEELPWWHNTELTLPERGTMSSNPLSGTNGKATTISPSCSCVPPSKCHPISGSIPLEAITSHTQRFDWGNALTIIERIWLPRDTRPTKPAREHVSRYQNRRIPNYSTAGGDKKTPPAFHQERGCSALRIPLGATTIPAAITNSVCFRPGTDAVEIGKGRPHGSSPLRFSRHSARRLRIPYDAVYAMKSLLNAVSLGLVVIACRPAVACQGPLHGRTRPPIDWNWILASWSLSLRDCLRRCLKRSPTSLTSRRALRPCGYWGHAPVGDER